MSDLQTWQGCLEADQQRQNHSEAQIFTVQTKVFKSWSLLSGFLGHVTGQHVYWGNKAGIGVSLLEHIPSAVMFSMETSLIGDTKMTIPE